MDPLRTSLSRFPLLLLMTLLAVACGSDETPDESVRIISFQISPAQLEAPGKVFLEWETTGASSIALMREGVALELGGASTSRGSLELTVDVTADFELVATGKNGKAARRTETVLVGDPNGLPLIRTFTAPAVVPADELGLGKVELSWTGVIGAAELRLEADDREPLLLEDSIPQGSIEVEISRNTTFTLVAANQRGETLKTALVRLVSPPTIEEFVASRLRVGTGEATTLSWATTGATRVELWVDGLRHDELDAQATTGSLELVLQVDAEVELRAFSEADQTAERSLEIQVGAPQIASFAGPGDRHWLGMPLALSWESLGGSSLSIHEDGDDEAVCEFDDPGTFDVSDCEWQASRPGTYRFLLQVENSSGNSSAEWTVAVLAGPEIRLFSASPQVLALGNEVTLRWEVLPDPAGEVPTLRLEDGQGNSHPALTPEGSLSITPAEAGRLGFHLEATTTHALSTRAEALIDVQVHGPPAATLTATPSHFDEAHAPEVLLSWTSAYAESLVLYRVRGEELEEVSVVAEEARSAGSMGVVPDSASVYRIVAINGMGAKAEAETAVTVEPPSVLRFDADREQTYAGGPVLLSWETNMATEVTLFDGPYVREEIRAPFLDLDLLGGVELPLGSTCSAYGGCPLLEFPPGFSFPFGGEARTTARIYSAGLISFDTKDFLFLENPGQNHQFPTSNQVGFAHLAPFWDALDWDRQLVPDGALSYLLHRDEDGDALVIQWKGIGFSGLNVGEARLTFEVILRGSGAFEYRYGRLDADTATLARAEGNSATIGYQLPGGSHFDNRNFNQTVRVHGSLEGRTFRYTPTPSLPKAGSFLWHPEASAQPVTATLVARRGSSSDQKTISLEVAGFPEMRLGASESSHVNQAFRLAWKTRFTTALEILDGNGTIRCAPEAQHLIEESFCDLLESVEGIYSYTIRLAGAHGAVAERIVQVKVHEPFGIDAFSANTPIVEPGGDLVLSWQTRNASDLRLYANGIEVMTPAPLPASGSLQIENLGVDTTFTLRLVNGVGMVVEESLAIQLWQVTLSATPNRTILRPGEALEVSLAATAGDGGPAPAIFGNFPMKTIEGPGATFEDISERQGATRLSRDEAIHQLVTFPVGFTFPFFGASHDAIRISLENGVASFEPEGAFGGVPGAFPAVANAAQKNSNLAPFWNITPMIEGSGGGVWVALLDPDTFVIQWTHMTLAFGTTPPLGMDLSFQLVLHRGGAFEYRFGAMSPPAPPETSFRCTPNTCENEANGSIASIGYQAPGGMAGFAVHYGPRQSAPAAPYPGGLSQRTFRYEPIVGSGTVTYQPSGAGTYLFCAPSGVAPACRSIRVEMPFAIETFSVSSNPVDFGDSLSLSWKSAGGTSLSIRDQSGAIVHETSDTTEIDQGSMIHMPTHRTTYTLEIKAADRVATRAVTVDVRRVALTATAPSSSPPGGSSTLSWTMSLLDPSMAPVIIKPMEEIAGSPFSEFDLAGDPEAIEVIGLPPVGFGSARFAFAEDFTFDYLGTKVSSVHVVSHGFLNFSSSANFLEYQSTNQPIPSTTSFLPHMAPFWDSFHHRSSGRVRAKRIDADRYVIQWSRMSLASGSAPGNEYDLNFQVVLHRNGDFEYRYGTMAPPPLGGNTGQCFPLSCRNEANGSSATIGFQEPAGRGGFRLHFGGSGLAATQQPIAGGLANRSWRYTKATGSGSVQISPGENTSYTVCALDPATGDIGCADPVNVSVKWGIQSFTASAAVVELDQPVELRWEGGGLDSLILKANGSVIASYSSGAQLQSGTFTHHPVGKTTYRLEGTSMGRSVALEQIVEVRTFALTVSAPGGKPFPGEEVTVSWTSTKYGQGNLAVAGPMSELDAGIGQAGAFMDVSGFPLAQRLTINPNFTSSVSLPFSFPYMGAQYSNLTVSSYGYVSFSGPPAGAAHLNQKLPSAAQPSVHLAVFWDNLTMKGIDSIWTHQVDADTFVIQWKNFNRYSFDQTLLPENRYDLNFQIWLHSDGSFEYRYGDMRAPAVPAQGQAAQCYPNTCVLEANGSSATIGYQTVDALVGYNVHFGADAAATVVEMIGGLSRRSFGFHPGQSGTAKVRVGRAQMVSVCGTLGGFVDCGSVEIEPVAWRGDLMITELMVEPRGAAAQWFEVRNLTKEPIDLHGFRITSKTSSHTIAHTLPVAPGDFVTLGRSGVPAPNYLYTDVSFAAGGDTVSLDAGILTVASTTWSQSWSIPAGKALNLDPSFQKRGVVANDDFIRWCQGSAEGTPGYQGAGCTNAFYDLDPASPLPFIDVSSIGTRVPALESKAAVAKIPLSPFSFPIFGEERSTLWASSNGWISFSEASPGGETQVAPGILPRPSAPAPAGPLIGAYWDSLECNPIAWDCSLVFVQGQMSGRAVVILQWNGFQNTSFFGQETLNFQVQLWEGGDVVIAFDDRSTNTSASGRFTGSAARIWMEGSDRANHLTALYRTATDLRHQTYHFIRK